MTTRTMRRGIYEAHESKRKSQIRKMYISQCRDALFIKLKVISLVIIPMILFATAVVNTVMYNVTINDTVNKSRTAEAIVLDDETETEYTASKLSSVISVDDASVSVFYSSSIIPFNKDNQVLYDFTSSSDVSIKYDLYIIDDETTAEYVIEDEEIEEILEEPVVVDASYNDPVDPGEMGDLTVAVEEEEEVVPPVEEVVDVVEEQEIVQYDNYTYYDDSGYQYTQEDYEYLLMAIVGEAQCYSKEEQLYVGSVVLNRLHNTKYFTYATCVKDVVLAKGQYSCFSDGNAYRTPTETNIEVANELIQNGSVLPVNVVYQSTVRQGDGIYAQIGNTYFCYQD